MRSLCRYLVYAFLACGAVAADSARPSPAFTMTRAGAAPVSLSQYRGKIVALAFILTTCSHCQQLTTELNPIAREYAGRGVQFLECAFNGDASATMPEFLQRFQPQFPVGYSTQEAVMAYLQHTIIDPRPLYVPHMVFLDRAGIIRADYPGESDFFHNSGPNIRGVLDRMLKTSPPRKK